jgi:hypothetical protein
MSQIEIKNSFIELGKFLSQFSLEQNLKKDDIRNNDLFYNDCISIIESAQHKNGWFIPEQVYFALQSWAEALTEDSLNQWLQPYDFSSTPSKTVGLILAGNIPMVGFHDLVSVLIAGHKAVLKTSSNDPLLIPFLVKYLVAIYPEMGNRVTFVDGKLEHFDAVIATGSNNTARYFEYYFQNKPSIIRKNRNSAAVLTGDESPEEMKALGEDIFRYFGLGCRNVSKLFVPKGYNFDAFFNGMFEYQDIIKYKKYANNYDYNKAVFLMSNFKLLDNGFLTIKEDTSYSSPISSVFYEYYEDLNTLQKRLAQDKDQIQCIVANNIWEGTIPFGKTQKPNLWDYADNVDTLAFLQSI